MIDRQRFSSLNSTVFLGRLVAVGIAASSPWTAWSLAGLGALVFACTLAAKKRLAPSLGVITAALALVTVTPSASVVSGCAIALAALATGLFRTGALGSRAAEIATAMVGVSVALATNETFASLFRGALDCTAFLALLGTTTLFALNLAEFNDRTLRACLRVPLVTVGALWMALAVFWQVGQREQDEYLRALVGQKAAGAAQTLRASVEEISNAMNRYARRVEYLGASDRAYLRIDSDAYLKQLPILRRIGVTDQALDVIWSFPESLEHQTQGFNQGKDPRRAAAFSRAGLEQKPILSAEVRLIGGEQGFILAIPMTRKRKPSGFVYSALGSEALFRRAVPDNGVQLVVFDGDKQVYATTGNALPSYGVHEHVQVGLADWDLIVAPTAAFLARNSSQAPLGLLIAGILITLMLWLTLRASALANWQNARSAEWRKALLNSADYAIISCDTKGTIQTFNRAAERLLGYTARDVIGKLTPKAFHIEQEVLARRVELEREFNRPLEDGMEVFVAKAATGLADEHEWTFRRQDGSLVPTSLSLSALKDNNGEIYGYIGIAIDLSEKRRAQEELRLAHSRLERVVEASGEGFWERDFLTRDVYFIDDRARHFFGLGPDEAATYEKIVRHIPPEDRDRLVSGIEAHVREQTEGFNIEFKIFNQQLGEERWVRALGRVQTSRGASPRLVSTIRDVTDVVRSRERLQAALLKAEEATRAKSAFLASMSHEIRTPLNGVIGMTDVLLGTALSDEQRGYVEIVSQSGNALLRLINDILDFSKIEAGKMELDEAPYDLVRLVENQANILAARAKAARVVLATFISPDLPEQLYGDSSRLAQILLNLISNAIKFTPRGGISVNVTPSAFGVRFEVKDTGRGIAAENRAKLFRPFVQESNAIAGEFGGTGLGLSISKQFVELMGGTIGVDSELGRGSTFWFELPLRAALSATPVALPFADAPVIPRALIGDVDPFTAEVIERYLRAWKVQTVSGSSATAGAFELGFVMTPTKTSALRTVLVLEFGAKIDEDERKKQGVDGVLRVPIKRAELIAALKDERQARTLPLASTKAQPSGARILVADDNSVNRQVARSMLEALGHQVQTANDGFEAVALAGQGGFDLILMDCQMPGMDGFAATREIRRSGNAVPVIALTANAGNEYVEQCYTAGMNAFLTKPIRKDRLAEALAPWLTPKAGAA